MTRSEFFRFRTGTSGLSDDELLLFDVLVSRPGIGLWWLRAENFGWKNNFPTDHRFKDRNLARRLYDWREQGLLETWLETDPWLSRHFRLSASGGALWAVERLPAWEHYCEGWWEGSQDDDRPARPRPRHREEILVVTASSRSIACAFARSAARYEHVRPVKRWRVRRLSPWRSSTMHWHPFPKAWRLHQRIWDGARQQQAESHRLQQRGWRKDWEQEQREQVWWRDCTQLVELRLEGKVGWHP